MTILISFVFVLMFLILCMAIVWSCMELIKAIDRQTKVQKRIADALEKSAEATEKLNKMIVNYYPGATEEQ